MQYLMRLADLIRSRAADAEQAELRRKFLANPPAVWHAANKAFDPLKIAEIVRKSGEGVRREQVSNGA